MAVTYSSNGVIIREAPPVVYTGKVSVGTPNNMWDSGSTMCYFDDRYYYITALGSSRSCSFYSTKTLSVNNISTYEIQVSGVFYQDNENFDAFISRALVGPDRPSNYADFIDVRWVGNRMKVGIANSSGTIVYGNWFTATRDGSPHRYKFLVDFSSLTVKSYIDDVLKLTQSFTKSTKTTQFRAAFGAQNSTGSYGGGAFYNGSKFDYTDSYIKVDGELKWGCERNPEFD